MSDEPWQRDEPDSPCVQVCVIHRASGLCTGCLRSGEEIAAWPDMRREERLALMAELPGRRHRLARRRGGRRGRQGLTPS